MADKKLPKGVSLHRGKLRIAFRPAGHKNQVKRSLGLVLTKANLKVAEMKLNAIRHEIMLGTFDIGTHFPNDPLSQTTPLYIREFLEQYHIARGRWKPQSRLNQDTYVNTLESEMGEKCDIKQIKVADAVKLQHGLANTKKAYYVNLLIALLRKSFKRAILAEIIKTNPFESLESLSDKTHDEDYTALNESSVYTIAEAEAICNEIRLPEKRRLFTFLFWSGIRHGEAAALKREDVCLPYIIVRRNISRRGHVGTPKTNRGRKILLPSLAISAITKQLGSHTIDNVWTHSNGKPFSSSEIIGRSTWSGAIKRAKLRKLVPYTTRHSFASWMLKAGEPETVIAAHLGHASLAMLRRRYAHFIPESKPKWSLDDPAKVVELRSRMKDSKKG